MEAVESLEPEKSHGDDLMIKQSLPGQHVNALLAVAKKPTGGQTKTRLCPPLAPDQAADLYECFLLDTLELMERVPEARPAIVYTPESEGSYFQQLRPDIDLIPQEGPDLGARLDNALNRYLALGYEAVAIMSTDSPTLPPQYVSAAFDALAGGADVALGPCHDGGYYLIGVKEPAPDLLREVRMSTPSTAADTIAMARSRGLQVELLPEWYDVDDAAALARLWREINDGPCGAARRTKAFLRVNSSWLESLL